MKNKEKYADKILEIACLGKSFAINKKTMEITSCASIDCADCFFRSNEICEDEIKKWSEAECKDPLTADRVAEEFDNFCNGRQCKDCQYKDLAKYQYKKDCPIHYIFDNYEVKEKEVSDNEK